MNQAKYIIIGVDTPVVFDETLVHANVARALGAATNITGAGFCQISSSEFVCWGESISLGVKSNGDHDSLILTRRLGGHR